MKITEARTYLVPSTWRQLTILELVTDEGVTGTGEGTVHQCSNGVEGMIRDLVPLFVLGQDPRRIEQLWDQMYRGSFWGRGGGPIITAAMSAIEEACWDIKGKALGVPAWELLGGQCRERLRVYANGWYRDARRTGTPAAFARCAEDVVKLGYTAMKFDPFMEAMTMDESIPGKVLSQEHEDRAIARVKAVREAVGPKVDILIEVHGWLGALSAIKVGRRLEEFRPFFYEEPVDPSNPEVMLQVKQKVNIPVASGERMYTRYGFRPFLEKQALDIIQPDINIDGGILETKKIAAAADTYHIPVAPHNCWGPVGTAAAVQFDASTPNFLIQEWFAWETDLHFAIVDEPFEKKIVDGYLPVASRPGLGVELVHKVIDPYRANVIT